MRTRVTWPILVAASVALLPSGTLSAQPGPHPSSDRKAVKLADKVQKALGGQKAWGATRFLRFDFRVDRQGQLATLRSHWWDKHTGRYRLEGKTREGDAFLVLMNIHTKEGTAYVKGAPVQGDELKQYLDRGFGAWTNDTYWLLMPYKMKDPGVILGYDGEEKTPEGKWDKVLLTFDSVGLTPKDKYWVYVNKKTGLVDRWDFVLKGEKVPPTTFTWSEWKQHGKILLASQRENVKGQTRISFPVLDAPDAIPDSVFTSPDPAHRPVGDVP